VHAYARSGVAVFSDGRLDLLGRTQHVARTTGKPTVYGTTVYPSFLHPTAHFNEASDTCALAERKTLLVAMSFALNTANHVSNQARRMLVEGCMNNTDLCAFVPLNHSREFSTADFEATVRMYSRAKYCVVPTGDSYTSKRFFDAVSACCLPVVANVDRARWVRAPLATRAALTTHARTFERREVRRKFISLKRSASASTR